MVVVAIAVVPAVVFVSFAAFLNILGYVLNFLNTPGRQEKDAQSKPGNAQGCSKYVKLIPGGPRPSARLVLQWSEVLVKTAEKCVGVLLNASTVLALTVPDQM